MFRKKSLVLPATCTDECAEIVKCSKEKGTHLPIDLTHELYKAIKKDPKTITKSDIITFLNGLMKDGAGETRVSRNAPFFPSKEYIKKHGEKSQEDWEKSCSLAIKLCESAKVPDPLVVNGVMQRWVDSAAMRETKAKEIYNKLVDCMNHDGSGAGAGTGAALDAGGKKKSKRKKRRKSKKRKSKKKRTRRRRR